MPSLFFIASIVPTAKTAILKLEQEKAAQDVSKAYVSRGEAFIYNTSAAGLHNLPDVKGKRLKFMKRETGLEPATLWLGTRCSTTELLALKIDFTY
jgi:hypothetical protein